jgi:hypothetical protein
MRSDQPIDRSPDQMEPPLRSEETEVRIMTRKQATLLERKLRAVGVYKPYVGADNTTGTAFVESYPLTAIITPGPVDPEMGPVQNIKITDCTLARIGQDSVLTTSRVFIGQDLIQRVSELLMDFHGPAHERSIKQDAGL